jgi:ferrochelatase
MKTGILLLNLGTPDSCDAPAIRRYLAEFLMDPYVVDIPWIARFLLVHGIILRTRPGRGVEAYLKIWTDRGSPLLFHSQDLTAKLQARMGDEYPVALAMRYGNPSVPSALERFRAEGVRRLVVVPLYPQDASATTGSSIDWVRRSARKVGFDGDLAFVPPFYANESFLGAFADRVRREQADFRPDHVVFSFHGLPERHLKKGDPTKAHCLVAHECSHTIVPENENCYRAQCFFTARRIAEIAGIPKEEHSIAFQSRLGRARWIMPYLDPMLRELAFAGKKRILVVAPSFVADCLETLEEIAIRAKETFVELGGEDLRLVPSLNSDDRWVDCVRDLALRAAEDGLYPRAERA